MPRYKSVSVIVGKDSKASTEAIISDLHVPYHDRRALGCVLGYLSDNPPDGFTIDGDLTDFYQLSRFRKDPARALETQYDLDETNYILDLFDSVLPPKTKKRMILGNHDLRMMFYLLDRAPELSGMRCLDLRRLLKFAERGYEVIMPTGREASTFVGKVEVGHFDKAMKHSAFTAKALVEERGCNVIQAHTHRLGAHYKRKRGTGEQLGGWEIGCLCDLNPEYVNNPDWQQGFATITRCKGSDRFHVALHEILGGELLAGGRRY